MEPDFPIEVVLDGNPRSLQASAASLTAWKETVEAAVRQSLPEGAFLTEAPIRFTFYWFSNAGALGDLDNMLKPILDALVGVVVVDDHQIQSICAEYFPPSRAFDFIDPSPALAGALERERPCIYICVEERA